MIVTQQSALAKSDAHSAALRLAMSSSGAFPFVEGSADAAQIVALPPGAYTVVVESVDGTPGIALVEAYELPPN